MWCRRNWHIECIQGHLHASSLFIFKGGAKMASLTRTLRRRLIFKDMNKQQKKAWKEEQKKKGE
jgi:hypothetical protein